MNILKGNAWNITGMSSTWGLAIIGTLADIEVWLSIGALLAAILVSVFTIRKLVCDYDKNKLEQDKIKYDIKIKEQQFYRELEENKKYNERNQ